MAVIVGVLGDNVIGPPLETSGDDTILTFGGNDKVTTSGGYDIVDTGAGDDVLVTVANLTQGFTADLGIGNDYVSVSTYVNSRFFLGLGNDVAIFRPANGTIVTATLGDGRDFVQADYSLGGTLVLTDFAAGAGGDTFRFDSWFGANAAWWSSLDSLSDNGLGSPFAASAARLVDTANGAQLQVRVSAGANWSVIATFEGRTANDFTAENFLGWAPNGAAAAGSTLSVTEAALRYAVIDSVGNDVITGTSAGGYIHYSHGQDTINAGGGNDVIEAGLGGASGLKIINAGSGDDVVVLSGIRYGSDGQGNPLGETVRGIVHGDDGNDQISGGFADDLLFGDAGNDTINGGGGADQLTGGSGVDTLTGGLGNDLFVDTAAGLNGDTITDFAAGDRLVISDARVANFSLSASGNVLSYTGGSVTIGGVLPQNLLFSKAAGGGVQVALTRNVDSDFNGDGRSDALLLDAANGVTVLRGQADGSLQAVSGLAANSLDASWRVAGVGDFNGDGREDVLWRHSSGEIGEWLGQVGQFTNNGGAAANPVDNSWKVVMVADYNGDGRDDILWRHSSGEIGQWVGTANGGFANNGGAAANVVDNSWKIVASGDFNGDGNADVIFQHTTGVFASWQGTDSGKLVNTGAVMLGATGITVGAADFNGDGRDDVMTRDANGALTIWLGQTDGQFGASSPASQVTDLNWRVAHLADYNGDGRTDILWKHTSGASAEWLATANGDFVNTGPVIGLQGGSTVQSPDLYL